MFREDSRPSTGRSLCPSNRNTNQDTSLWAASSTLIGSSSTQQTNSRPRTSAYKQTSLWATPDELTQSSRITTARAPTPRTSLWGTMEPTRVASSRPQSPKTSLWGSDNQQSNNNTAAVINTRVAAPASVSVPRTGPFATEMDQPSAKQLADAQAAEQLRSALTYDIEERYRQTADEFVAADIDRSGFLEENEILRLCLLFNLPVEHVAAVFNQCDSKDGNGKLDYREFAHYLTRASFPTNPTSQTQAEQQQQVTTTAPVAVSVAQEAPVVAAAAPPAPSTGRADPRFASTGVSSIFGGPDSMPTPPSKFSNGKGRSLNRNYAPTSLW